MKQRFKEIIESSLQKNLIRFYMKPSIIHGDPLAMTRKPKESVKRILSIILMKLFLTIMQEKSMVGICMNNCVLE